jgi:hypothetical protein
MATTACYLARRMFSPLLRRDREAKCDRHTKGVSCRSLKPLQHSLPSRSPPAACLRSAGSVSRCSASDQPIARSIGREPYKNNASGKRPLTTSAKFLPKFLSGKSSTPPVPFSQVSSRQVPFSRIPCQPGMEGKHAVQIGEGCGNLATSRRSWVQGRTGKATAARA